MPTVDSGTALYLKSEALYSKATAGSAGTWGDRAVDSEIISPLATVAGANAEAARQIAVLEGPLVEDQVLVPGRRKDLIGKVINLQGETLDYVGGKLAFVLGFEEGDATTLLSVIRKLA